MQEPALSVKRLRRPAESSRDGTDDATQAILNDVRRLVRFVQGAAAQTTCRLGITPSQLFVLQALADTPSLSLNDLAARVYADQSTVSVVVSRLVASGLVSRRRSSTDRRCLRLAVSAKGIRLLRRGLGIDAPQVNMVAGIRRLLSRERDDFARALARFLDVMGLHAAPAPMLLEEDRPKARSKRRRRSP